MKLYELDTLISYLKKTIFFINKFSKEENTLVGKTMSKLKPVLSEALKDLLFIRFINTP